MSHWDDDQSDLTQQMCVNAISNVIAQRDKYKQALRDIKKHMELMAGDMVGQSAIYMIASKALEGSQDE